MAPPSVGQGAPHERQDTADFTDKYTARFGNKKEGVALPGFANKYKLIEKKEQTESFHSSSRLFGSQRNPNLTGVRKPCA